MFNRLAKLGVSFAVAGLGTTLLIGDVSANQDLTAHGAAFQPWNAGQANDIDYLSNGVRTIASSSRSVVASIPYAPSSARYQWVTMNGDNYDGNTTSATFFTYDQDGNFRASQWGQSDESTYALGAILPTTPDTNGTDDDVYIAVLAELPASGGGVIRGVRSRPYNW
jgi:hypothetical protein